VQERGREGAERIAEDVNFLGQSVTCPECHGTCNAPGGPAQTVQVLNLLGGLVTIGLGIALVALGRGCL
jgi:hypothetical protein